MGFDQLNARRVDPVFVVHLLLQTGLRFRIGCGDAVGPAVLIDTPALDDGINHVPIFFCLGQPFQHHHPHPFAGNKAVGSLIEGEALALGREHAGLRGHDMQVGPRHHRDSSGQGQIAGSGAQAVTSMGHGHQRGRARRIDRYARTLQIQKIRNARRQDRHRTAGEALCAQLMLARQLVIVPGGTAHEDSTLAA